MILLGELSRDLMAQYGILIGEYLPRDLLHRKILYGVGSLHLCTRVKNHCVSK
jgi:hypothetical protein